MNMTSASTPREPPIPPSAPAQVEQALTPEAAARLCAALRDLLWLMLYVTLMRLLGYRIRREASLRTAPRRMPAAPPIATALPKPRQQHRYIDRQMCLELLARINADLAPASVAPSPTLAAALPRPIIRRAQAAPPSKPAPSSAATILLHPRHPYRLALAPSASRKNAFSPSAFARSNRYDTRTKTLTQSAQQGRASHPVSCARIASNSSRRAWLTTG
jgi:hypothetical protein